MSSVAGILALAMCVLQVSCNGGDKPRPEPAPAPRPKTMIGYGIVNSWHRADPVAYADLLARNGLTLTEIEWVPWSDPPQENCPSKHGGGRSYRTFPAEAQRLVIEMRRRGVLVFVNLVNWNGCAPRSRPDSWFRAQLDDVRLFGETGILLGAVSEPWTNHWPAGPGRAKAKRWTEIARAGWTGVFIVPDRGGGGSRFDQPEYAIRADYIDAHFCDDRRLELALKRGLNHVIASTDCTPIVNPGPERAARFTRLALQHNAHFLIYDFANRNGRPDVAVVEAMGREIKAYLGASDG